MSNSLGKATKLQGKYLDFLDSAFERYDKALAEVRERKYSSERLISDTIASWSDLLSLVYFPFQLIGEPQTGPPTVKLTVASSAAEAWEAVFLGAAEDFEVQAEDLGGPQAKDTIPAQHVKARVVSDGRYLVVYLAQLDQLTLTAKALYKGNILRVDDPKKIVAAVEVRVGS
jgi:hypothetical protein